MNDSPDLSNQLNAAADTVDVGVAGSALIEVREQVGKRKRRRNAVVGVAAAGALVASGAVIANVAGNGDDDRLLTTADAEATDVDIADDVTDTLPAPETTAVPVPDATAPAGNAPIPVQVVPANGTVVDDVGVQSEFGNSVVLPWQGGFLAISQQYSPQLLPSELPEEITELFSQEVLDLFADGLPATIDEATQMLQDAGLLDEVTDVIASNSEASDAIYSGGQQASVVTARFSADGTEWVDADLNVPDGVVFDAWSMSSTGERLAFVSNPAFAPFADTNTPDSFDVYSTTDLVAWDSQSVPAPETPVDLPEYFNVQTHPSRLVATPDRWLLSIETYTDINAEALLGPDILEEVGSNYGVGTSPDGIEVYTGYSEEGGEEVTRFTWEELGIEVPDDMFGPGESQIISSEWAGAPTVLDIGVEGEFWAGNVVALDNGFAFSNYSGTVSVSDDGVDWTEIEVPEGMFGGQLMALNDTVVLFGDGNQGGASPYLLDRAAGTWSELDIAGLPEQFHLGNASDGAAVVQAFDEEIYSDGGPFEQTFVATRMTAEVDGYRLELNASFADANGDVSYTLTNIESSEVVVTETLGLESFDGDFEFAEEVYDIDGQEGIRVLDPETGDELVAIPFSEMTEQAFDADGNEVEMDFSLTEGSVEETEADVYEPEQWLIASNGTSWIVEQLSESGQPYEESGVGSIAVSDGVVLISKYDGTFVRYEIG